MKIKFPIILFTFFISCKLGESIKTDEHSLCQEGISYKITDSIQTRLNNLDEKTCQLFISDQQGELTEIPVQVLKKYKCLTKLEFFASSSLNSIPDDLASLYNLSTLNIELCENINYISPDIFNSNLRSIKFIGNPNFIPIFSNDDKDIVDSQSDQNNLNTTFEPFTNWLNDLNVNKKLDSFTLAGYGLTDFPINTFQKLKFSYINLNDNFISQLNYYGLIDSCVNELRLDNNKLTSIPNFLILDNKIKILSLSGNNLYGSEISNLFKINYKIIYLENCGLLTANFLDIPTNNSIEELYISGNELNSFPVELSNLTSLKVLHIGQCPLTEINFDSLNFSHLEELYISIKETEHNKDYFQNKLMEALPNTVIIVKVFN